MDDPGPFQLTMGGNAFSVVNAGTLIGDWIEGFSGLFTATFQAQFIFGAGSGTINVYIQTSIDQGQTPVDIAAFGFATTNATQLVTLSGVSLRIPGFTPPNPFLTPTQQGLATGSCNDGILGDRFRAVVVSTGSYSNSTLVNVTGVAR